MAVTVASLEGRIVTEMENIGAVSTGQYSWVQDFAHALATAVVDEIQANAEVTVTSGSSAGTYPVE